MYFHMEKLSDMLGISRYFTINQPFSKYSQGSLKKKEINKVNEDPYKSEGTIFISGIAICSLIRIIVKYLNTFDLRILMINAIDSISELSVFTKQNIRLFLISESFIES